MWHRFCQSLAHIGAEGEVLAWWGMQNPHPWLTPIEELAQCYPCGEGLSRACQRIVEPVGAGEFVAACSNVPARCKPVSVPKEKLLLYRVSREILCSHLCDALGLVSASPATPHLVGMFIPRPAIHIPVYCLYGKACLNLEAHIPDTQAKHSLVLVPTEAQIAEVRERAGLKVFSLEGLFEADASGHLRFSATGARLWHSWMHEVAPVQEHGTYRFATPPNAKWSHIRLSLGRDDHTLAILCRTPNGTEVTDAVHCMALGMAHRKHGTPDKQWHNLSRIITHGCYDCRSQSQQKKMEMPMSRLRTRLKEIFSIADDPIPFRDNAYRPEFRVG